MREIPYLRGMELPETTRLSMVAPNRADLFVTRKQCDCLELNSMHNYSISKYTQVLKKNLSIERGR